MKTTGIILLVIGCLSTLGGIIGTIGGREPNFAGLTFVVIGGFLMYRANQKKEEAEKKKQWEEGNSNKD
ncbi:MAG TPA: hypothetical protein PKK00_13175 [Bacteroidales bacterium]|jgi:hypothetical protein|nr:hypothetical protein [Bacteroidales bacterium]